MIVRPEWLNLRGYGRITGRAQAARVALRELTGSTRRTRIRLRATGRPFSLRPNTSDLAVVTQVFVGGEYDADYGDRVHCIVDGGANIGASAIYFAQRFPQARVLAIEPDPDNFSLLLENAQAWPQVAPINAALWPHEAMVEIISTKNNAWERMVTPAQDGTIPAITMDRVLDLAGAEFIDLLKLDIEGSERELLRSSPQWLSRVRAVVVELHDALAPGASQVFAEATQDFAVRQTHGEHVVVRRA